MLPKPNSFVVPLIALGVLAFGAACPAADDGLVVASADAPPVHRGAPVFKAPTPTASAVKESWGQVSGEMVNVRSGPGTDHAALTTLKKGDFVKIEATQTGWLTIQWPENVPLWVAKEGIHVQAGTAGSEHPATVKVAAQLRSRASNKASAICTLDPGTKLVVLDEANGWLKIKAPEAVRAYISAKFVTPDAHKPDTAAAAASVGAKPSGSEKPAAAFAAPAPASSAPAVNKPASKPAAKAHASAKKPAANLVEIEPESAPASVVLEVPPEASFETPPEPAPAPAPKAIVRAEIPQPEATPSLLIEPPAPAPAPKPIAAPAPISAPAPVAAPVPVFAPAPVAAVRTPPPAPVATTVSTAASLSSNRYSATALNDRSFRSVVENNGLALVDFNAHWCGPCRRMSPVIESLAGDINSEAAIAKVDVDESPETASRFGVHSIPCLILFKDGREVARHYGIHSKEELKDWIRSTR